MVLCPEDRLLKILVFEQFHVSAPSLATFWHWATPQIPQNRIWTMGSRSGAIGQTFSDLFRSVRRAHRGLRARVVARFARPLTDVRRHSVWREVLAFDGSLHRAVIRWCDRHAAIRQ